MPTKTYSQFLHVPIAAALFAIGLLLILFVPHGGLWSAVVLASAACAYREVTQAEYRWIELNGGLRAAMPGYEGLLFWKWNKHSLLETLWAILTAVALALLVIYFAPASWAV